MIFQGKAADNHSAAFFCVNFITLYKLLIINVSAVTGEFGRSDHANDHSQQFLSVICLYFMNFVFLLIKLYKVVLSSVAGHEIGKCEQGHSLLLNLNGETVDFGWKIK